MYDATGFPGGASGEEPTCQCRRHETWDSIPGSLSWEDPLERGMTSHSNILAWKIPWTEEPFRLVHWVTKGWTRLRQLSMRAHI